MKALPMAVQLYTVRNAIALDWIGTLGRIAEIGYEGIELWFRDWIDVDLLKRQTEASGLAVVGAHFPFNRMREGMKDIARYMKTLGCTDVAVPAVRPRPTSSDDWKRRIGEVAAIADRCAELGMRLSYHCHFDEFDDRVDGGEAFEYIFATLGPERLKLELDTYFAAARGKDVAALLRRFAGRVPLLHVKDWAAGTRESPTDTVVGEGVIDWPAVLPEAARAGVEWCIVEQTTDPDDALACIARSYGYLKTLFDEVQA
ncbi:MAG: sugar phosphate isomerase/epimerase [Planctomycetes bacterium]|nr:sugar phosphate isomerase/epimerase [Planctomycetota bacterium]